SMQKLVEHHGHTAGVLQKEPRFLRFYVRFMTIVDASRALGKDVADAARRLFRKSLKVLKIYEVICAQASQSIRHVQNTHDFSGLASSACGHKKVLPLPRGRS